jgi:acyl-coenzyme A thioesterase PaaI-like protein
MANLYQTLRVRLFTLLKVPLIAWLRPVVEALDAERCVLRLPLTRRSKNHVGSMYVGALCTGAETCMAILLFQRIFDQKLPVVMVARTLDAEFLRRATGDVRFTCEGGATIEALMRRVMEGGEREEAEVTVLAHVREAGPEPVARFRTVVSAKRKRRG